ncbi:hypothetical protein PLAN_150009 [Planktothrix rubescens CCAP 1459/22]|uniref:Uncharacterized protein n=1 Tax=Planktothrix rubescens CCAP 1459/22 TaxID=329571 RepID=A0A6J7ZJ61_PLARU|nr:hypothetical protein PLAN_150009 [Planktothrix rubescens NIVA-CYA 18]
MQKRTLAGCELAVVIVKPSDAPPVRFNGRVWVRVGPRRATATHEWEISFFRDKELTDNLS